MNYVSLPFVLWLDGRPSSARSVPQSLFRHQPSGALMIESILLDTHRAQVPELALVPVMAGTVPTPVAPVPR